MGLWGCPHPLCSGIAPLASLAPGSFQMVLCLVRRSLCTGHRNPSVSWQWTSLLLLNIPRHPQGRDRGALIGMGSSRCAGWGRILQSGRWLSQNHLPVVHCMSSYIVLCFGFGIISSHTLRNTRFSLSSLALNFCYDAFASVVFFCVPCARSGHLFSQPKISDKHPEQSQSSGKC